MSLSLNAVPASQVRLNGIPIQMCTQVNTETHMQYTSSHPVPACKHEVHKYVKFALWLFV